MQSLLCLAFCEIIGVPANCLCHLSVNDYVAWKHDTSKGSALFITCYKELIKRPGEDYHIRTLGAQKLGFWHITNFRF